MKGLCKKKTKCGKQDHLAEERQGNFFGKFWDSFEVVDGEREAQSQHDDAEGEGHHKSCKHRGLHQQKVMKFNIPC